MAVTKVLARGWTFFINTGTYAVPVWTQIHGINSFSPSPEKNDADTTDFDDAGSLSHLPVSRGRAFTLEGFYKVDVSNGDRDEGQAAVEALSDSMGVAGIGNFKFVAPDASIDLFSGSVNVTPPGGGSDDAAAWSVEITVTEGGLAKDITYNKTFTADTSTEGHGALYAFDDDEDTYWEADGVVGWLKVDLGSGKTAIVRRYSIQAATTAGEADKAPKAWTLQGSNNDSAWTTIHTVAAAAAFTVGERRSYDVTNAVAYRYYKLDVTENQGDATSLRIGEVTMAKM